MLDSVVDRRPVVASRLSPEALRSGLQIEDFQVYVVGTPWRNLTMLELTTKDGLIGWGEARVVGKTAAVVAHLESKEGYYVGRNALDTEDIRRSFIEDDFGVAGEVAMTALALVEMACWDLKGKALGVPVYELIGGKIADDVKIRAYANGWYTGERTP